MDDAALHLFSALRGDASRGTDPARHVADPLEAFACLVFGRPPGALTGELRRVVRDAVGAADRRLKAAREMPPGRLRRAHPFREVYRAVRPLAAAIKLEPLPVSTGPRRSSALAMEGLLHLRHRQRAALTLHCVLGFREDEVAYVLGISAAEAHRIVEAAIASVRRSASGPVDVGIALRGRAGPRLSVVSDLPARPEPAARLPREVFRVLIAPVVVPEMEPNQEPERPADAKAPLLAPPPFMPQQVATEAPSPAEPTVVRISRPVEKRRSRRIRLSSLWAAAAILVVAVALLVPATAREQAGGVARSSQALAPHAAPVAPVVPSAQVLAARFHRVRPGDSLWRIAARELGDPLLWPEIWRANRGARMPEGVIFSDPNLILPGWHLRLPA